MGIFYDILLLCWSSGINFCTISIAADSLPDNFSPRDWKLICCWFSAFNGLLNLFATFCLRSRFFFATQEFANQRMLKVETRRLRQVVFFICEEGKWKSFFKTSWNQFDLRSKFELSKKFLKVNNWINKKKIRYDTS